GLRGADRPAAQGRRLHALLPGRLADPPARLRRRDRRARRDPPGPPGLAPGRLGIAAVRVAPQRLTRRRTAAISSSVISCWSPPSAPATQWAAWSESSSKATLSSAAWIAV